MSFEIQLFLQLLLAGFLGSLIGLEREFQKRHAGLRTFSLVSLGSCLLTVLAVYFTSTGVVNIDPARVIQAVAIGIGFIGSGLIIHDKGHVEGLTTAAGLWAGAGIGVTVGLGLYLLSILGTILVIIILAGLKIIDQKFFPDN